MTDHKATPVRDRLEKILFPIIAVPVVGFLCLRAGWKWVRFILWASTETR